MFIDTLHYFKWIRRYFLQRENLCPFIVMCLDIYGSLYILNIMMLFSFHFGTFMIFICICDVIRCTYDFFFFFFLDMFTQGKREGEFKLMTFALLGVVSNRLNYPLGQCTYYSINHMIICFYVGMQYWNK
jgi:hypothetical protein